MLRKLMIACFMIIFCLSGCQKPNDKPAITIAPSPTSIDYTEVGREVVDGALDYIFGKPKDGPDQGVDEVMKKLGKPLKKVDKKFFHRWYFRQDVQIDVVYQSGYPSIFNYIHVGHESKIKLNDFLTVGSSKENVIQTYGQRINPKYDSNREIVVGDKFLGLVFKISNDKVYEIYIGLGRGTYGRSRI